MAKKRKRIRSKKTVGKAVANAVMGYNQKLKTSIAYTVIGYDKKGNPIKKYH